MYTGAFFRRAAFVLLRGRQRSCLRRHWSARPPPVSRRPALAPSVTGRAAYVLFLSGVFRAGVPAAWQVPVIGRLLSCVPLRQFAPAMRFDTFRPQSAWET